VTSATIPIDGEELDATPEFFVVRPSAADVRRIAEAVAAGQVTVPVARVMPLEQAAEAQAITDRGGAGGKVILVPSACGSGTNPSHSS
jgi:NADPH:quinone reductase-like Zn-dependent oxidoreductase